MKKDLTLKQKAFAEAYYNKDSKTFGNGVASAKVAKYKGNDKTLSVVAAENLAKPCIIEAGERIEVDCKSKVEHSRDISLKNLQLALDMAIRQGNVAGMVAAEREKNAISGLHDKVDINISQDLRHSTAKDEEQALKDKLARLERMRSLPSAIDDG